MERFIEKREESKKKGEDTWLGQHSKSEDLLTEILCTLNRKGEAMKQFADLSMSSIIDSGKVQAVS